MFKKIFHRTTLAFSQNLTSSIFLGWTARSAEVTGAWRSIHGLKSSSILLLEDEAAEVRDLRPWPLAKGTAKLLKGSLAAVTEVEELWDRDLLDEEAIESRSKSSKPPPKSSFWIQPCNFIVKLFDQINNMKWPAAPSRTTCDTYIRWGCSTEAHYENLTFCLVELKWIRDD